MHFMLYSSESSLQEVIVLARVHKLNTVRLLYENSYFSLLRLAIVRSRVFTSNGSLDM